MRYVISVYINNVFTGNFVVNQKSLQNALFYPQAPESQKIIKAVKERVQYHLNQEEPPDISCKKGTRRVFLTCAQSLVKRYDNQSGDGSAYTASVREFYGLNGQDGRWGNATKKYASIIRNRFKKANEWIDKRGKEGCMTLGNGMTGITEVSVDFEKIKNWFQGENGAWKSFREYLSKGWGSVMEGVKGVTKIPDDWIKIKNWFHDENGVWKSFHEYLSKVASSVMEGVKGVTKIPGDWIKIKNWFHDENGAWKSFRECLSKVAGSVMEGVKGVTKIPGDWIRIKNCFHDEHGAWKSFRECLSNGGYSVMKGVKGVTKIPGDWIRIKNCFHDESGAWKSLGNKLSQGWSVVGKGIKGVMQVGEDCGKIGQFFTAHRARRDTIEVICAHYNDKRAAIRERYRESLAACENIIREGKDGTSIARLYKFFLNIKKESKITAAGIQQGGAIVSKMVYKYPITYCGQGLAYFSDVLSRGLQSAGAIMLGGSGMLLGSGLGALGLVGSEIIAYAGSFIGRGAQSAGAIILGGSGMVLGSGLGALGLVGAQAIAGIGSVAIRGAQSGGAIAGIIPLGGIYLLSKGSVLTAEAIAHIGSGGYHGLKGILYPVGLALKQCCKKVELFSPFDTYFTSQGMIV